MTLKILQIVGYKNSGKTTVMCHLIKSIQSSGLKVAALKHHAHIDLQYTRDEKTDTGKYWGSGASPTILAGPESAQIDFSVEPPIDAYIAFYEHLDRDVLLVEGFKNAPYPKVVLLRSEADYLTLKELNHIQMFIVPEDVPFSAEKYPVFYREDVASYTSYINKWLEGQL